MTFSKHQLIEPQANTDLEPEQEVIVISSDDESKDEVLVNKKLESKSIALTPSRKKRTLLNVTVSGHGSPSKRWVTLNLNTTIEILDSDDEHPTAMKAIPTMMKAAGTATPVKVESGTLTKKMTLSTGNLSINEVAKDRDGRYIVMQKVKVDSIENFQEVPARWPIPPEGIDTAYVIDLSNDKKWQELDQKSKKKYLDCFIKQEVCPNISMLLKFPISILLMNKSYVILESRFLGEGDQRFNQSSNPHPVPWKSPHPLLGSSVQWGKTLWNVRQCNPARLC